MRGMHAPRDICSTCVNFFISAKWTEWNLADILFSFLCVCLSVCLCVRTQSHWFEWAEWRIVRREMYSNRVQKVDIISVRTRYCWKRRFIGFLRIWSDSRLKWGFRRNVQKCNSYITQNGFTAASRAPTTSWYRPAKDHSFVIIVLQIHLADITITITIILFINAPDVRK